MRVLTFNVFDLPPTQMFYVINKTLSRDRDQRLDQILKVLQKAAADRKNGWDVVFLQELWSAKYRQIFKEECGYKYCLDLAGNAMPEKLGFFECATSGYGSGLMILSRYPLKRESSYTYSHNGKWSHLSDGEVSVHKGVISAVVEHPELGDVLLLNTHMVARYKDQQYDDQRMDQLAEFVSYAKEQKAKASCPLIIGGDLNFGPWMGPQVTKLEHSFDFFDELTQKIIFDGEPLRFAPNAYQLPEMATYSGNLNGEGNPYVDYQTEGKQIIDHLLSSKGVRAVKAEICFSNLIEGDDRRLPFSDHYGLEVLFAKEETP